MCLHKLLQARLKDMRVKLCRRDIRMAEKRLQRTEIRAALQKMRGEGVP